MNELFPPKFFKKVGLSFVRAFLGVFVAGLVNIVPQTSDWSTSKAAVVALVLAAVTAGIRAVQALFTTLEPTV